MATTTTTTTKPTSPHRTRRAMPEQVMHEASRYCPDCGFLRWLEEPPCPHH